MAVDVQGKVFKVGQKVARACKLYVTDGLHIQICTVTKVDGDKVYLNESPRPMNFPDRLCIVGMVRDILNQPISITEHLGV